MWLQNLKTYWVHKMGHGTSTTFSHKDSYTTDNQHDNEVKFNSKLKVSIQKNKKGQTTLDLSRYELRKCFLKKYMKKKVEILKVNNNFLKTLPHHLAGMMTLQEIYLQHNQFRYFPVSLCPLYKLRILNLSYNELESLPYSLGSLTSLEKIDISYNNMTSLPDSIRLLRSLTELVVEGNYFCEVPSSIFYIEHLRLLNLNNNLLTYLPKHFVKLKELKFLFLFGNNIRKIHRDLQHYIPRLQEFQLGHQDVLSDSCENDRSNQLNERQNIIKAILNSTAIKNTSSEIYSQMPNEENITTKSHAVSARSSTEQSYVRSTIEQRLPSVPNSSSYIDVSDGFLVQPKVPSDSEEIYVFHSFVFSNSSSSNFEERINTRRSSSL